MRQVRRRGRLPGRVHFSNLTLRTGVTASRSLYDWWKTVLNGGTQRKNLSIILLGEDATEVKRWNVFNAWVCKYEGPSLNAKGSEVAIESVEIVNEGIELV